MTVLYALLGFYLALWIPKVGHWISHAILHLFIHKADHSERFVIGFGVAVWLLFISVPVLLLLRLPLLAVDAFVLILIFFKLFSPGH